MALPWQNADYLVKYSGMNSFLRFQKQQNKRAFQRSAHKHGCAARHLFVPSLRTIAPVFLHFETLGIFAMLINQNNPMETFITVIVMIIINKLQLPT